MDYRCQRSVVENSRHHVNGLPSRNLPTFRYQVPGRDALTDRPARALSSTARIPRPSIRHMADAHARNRCLECRPNSSELEIGYGGDLCVPDRIPHS
jgi:hypothetical protein